MAEAVTPAGVGSLADEPTAAGAGARRRVAPALDTSLAPAAFALLTVVLTARDQGGYFPTAWGWTVVALLGVLVTWAVAGGLTDAGRRDIGFLLALTALTAWIGLSILWSDDRAQSVLELERALVLLSGCTAFILLSRRTALPALTVTLVVAITSISTYSLSTRLFPGHLGAYDPIAGYRLSDPVGYWNALGIFCVMGTLLAAGLATESRVGLIGRGVGALSLVVLPVTVYFTFSRGSWLALACGFAVVVALSPHRIRLATEAIVFSIAPAVAVLLASRSSALTNQTAILEAAGHEGHRLAAILAGLALASMLLLAVVIRAERHPFGGVRAHRAYGAALLVVAVAVVAGGLVHAGGPVSLSRRAYDSFVAEAPKTEKSDLNNRLFTLNGNGRAQLWRAAISADRGHWLIGNGAGSFERIWDANAKQDEEVRDAHGLYVESLSELGIVGLVLFVVMLGIPLVAGVRARRTPVVPAIIAAYAAFVFHNGIDWDWELSAVALTGLFVGCLLLVARRENGDRAVAVRVRAAGGVAVLAVAGFALVAAIGNGALAHARSANAAHRYRAAESQSLLAARWMPWSPDPRLALGEAQLEQGDTTAARASFEKAISIDRRNWQAWLDLAAAVDGKARIQAVAEARHLFPRSPEISDFEKAVGLPDDGP